MLNERDRDDPKYKAWRYAVMARDGFQCQETGQKGGALEAHHILPWSEYPNLRFVVSNGITLSKEFHQSILGKEHDYIDKFKRIVAQNTIKYYSLNRANKKRLTSEKTAKRAKKFKKRKWFPDNPELRL